MDCIFCQIAEKQIPAELIHEDNHVVVFRDISPKAPEHYLIIPKEHIPTVNDLEYTHQNLLGHMVLTAQKIAKQLDIADTGYRLIMNCNQHGGQEVFHLHLHFMGGRTMHWPPG